VFGPTRIRGAGLSVLSTALSVGRDWCRPDVHRSTRRATSTVDRPTSGSENGPPDQGATPAAPWARPPEGPVARKRPVGPGMAVPDPHRRAMSWPAGDRPETDPKLKAGRWPPPTPDPPPWARRGPVGAVGSPGLRSDGRSGRGRTRGWVAAPRRAPIPTRRAPTVSCRTGAEHSPTANSPRPPRGPRTPRTKPIGYRSGATHPDSNPPDAGKGPMAKGIRPAGGRRRTPT
jgi:hypothetical protein